MSIFIRFANDYLWGVRYKLFAAILCGLYKFLLPVYIAWVIGNIVGILENDLINEEKLNQILNLSILSFLLYINLTFICLLEEHLFYCCNGKCFKSSKN